MNLNSLTARWNTLTTFQKAFVVVIGLLLVYSALTYLGSDFLNPAHLLALALILFIALPVHEMAHAATAVALGDDTPRRQGRFTLNPLAHLDPVGTIMIVLVGFGYAKPVQWDPRNIKVDYRTGAILVSLAGPFSNLALAVLGAALMGVAGQASMLFSVLGDFVWINTALFVFNLIPVPPLDGSHVLFALLPADMQRYRAQIAQLSPFFLMAVFIFGGRLISGPTQAIASALVNFFV